MNNINAFIKENKKVLAIIASCVVVSLVIIIVSNIINNNDNVNNEELSPDYVVNPYNLPSLDNLSVTTEPIMYDFVNGSLGLHEDLVKMVGGSSNFILVTKDGSSKLYAAMIHGGEGDLSIELLLPVFSSEPTAVNLDENNMNNFKNEISTLVSTGKVESVDEDGYTFYVIPYSVAFQNDSKLSEIIDFNWLISKYNEGELKQDIDNGMGIPTNIIREKCNIDKIKQEYYIDFNDSFWDNVNYGAKVKVYNKDRSDYCIISPIFQEIVAGYGEPIYMYTLNGSNYMMDIETLNQFLLENGYESIDSALSNKSYASQKEYEDKLDKDIEVVE